MNDYKSEGGSMKGDEARDRPLPNDEALVKETEEKLNKRSQKMHRVI